MSITNLGPSDRREDDVLADLTPSGEAILASLAADFPALGVRAVDGGFQTSDGRRMLVLTFSVSTSSPLAMNFRLHTASDEFAGSPIEAYALNTEDGWAELGWAIARAATTGHAEGVLEAPDAGLWDVFASSRGESYPNRLVSVAMIKDADAEH